MEPAKKEALAPGEKERLQRAHGLAAQMKVFTDVASQYMSVIRDAANQEDTTRLKDTADGLVAVYRQADQHIQQSPEKKKHKHLKKFEIALREQVSLLKSLQSLSSAAQRDLFTAAIAAGEALRKKVLGIIFEGGYTKKS